MKSSIRTSFVVKACAAAMCVTLAACGGGAATSDQADTSATEQTTEQAATETVDPSAKSDGVMTYAEYVAAAIDDPVTIEGFVQGKQPSSTENKASLYLQDKDGAYFVYDAECSAADYDKLVEGQKVKVEGYRAEWSGEIEVAEDATITIEDGTWIAEPVDVTDKLDSSDLIDYQNQKVTFKGLTIAASEDGSGNEVAFTYGSDGSGEQGDDLYFNVDDGTDTHTFTVESRQCDKDSETYKAVEGLKVGDTVDLEGFLYWYEGPNPHITSVTVK
ncbi:MAG: hypothetical protein J6S63_00005 [Atopobiaceae bacterium]|nr:hypothetical protein [Atopobiaceae bacterium]